MKEHLRRLLIDAKDDLARELLVREYLQARILESLQDQGLFLRWTFLGGTALRFLYAIPRFSEDLDFSLIVPGGETSFRTAAEAVRRSLTLEGYAIDATVSDEKTVASAWIKFPGLLHELGLSPHPKRTLSVKVELDTNPPAGARIETTVVRRHVILNLCHHDRASLLSGKIHAILNRPWAKGRDLFDLAWYLADRTWPEPNLDLLDAALAQTGWKGPSVTAASWREEVRKRVETLDWSRAQDDVRPFLERAADVGLVSAGSLLGLLQPRD